MTGWMLILVVAGAGGLGAGLRYAVDALVMRGRRGAFPVGILVVNVTGSFGLGLLTGLAALVDASWATAIGVGLLGGFTTFSTVSVETVLLGRRGRRDWAWLNLVGTLAASVAAAAIGVGLGRLLAGWIAG
ncbi:CrcB family protein [Microbacterium sp. BK668]|uniref:fluoride efflux transporter FluC n=1 Tax=Microbacterium sp. BK668 TaxID=2512118 RepID=UPI00105C3736|nr:CrcB family protein [Microbacterium sp. BK668]TDN90882.1 CrcB protein [Microbacterium sp. BK668]